jgi:4-amino-4-deoxy-L-arabinose transferase-like glycosyltransferase
VLNRTRQAWLGSWPLLLTVAVFAAVVVVINPLRETALIDDWSYADSVHRLLQTGAYHLSDWDSADPRFQIYWGAAVASLFGFSYGALRMSTLILSAASLLALYLLAREHGLRRDVAGLVVLGFLASPLILRFSFTFMTDIPFVSLTLIALYLLTRGLRTGSPALLAVGSVVAGAAILTRQFGVALLIGMIAVWAINSALRRRWLIVIAGGTVPAVALVVSYYQNLKHPSWLQAYSEAAESAFLRDSIALTLGSIGRIGVLVMYLGAFALPLGLGVAVAHVGASRGRRRRTLIARIVITAAVIVGAVAIYHPFGGDWLMPLIGLRLGQVALLPVWLRIVYTAAVLLAATAILGEMRRRYRSGGFGKLPPHQQLLDLTALGSLAGILLFLQFNDEYLLPLIPFALLILGRELGEASSLSLVLTAGLTLALLVAVTLSTRAILTSNQAAWRLGDRAMARGASPAAVAVSWPWYSKHNFDAFLREVRPAPPQNTNDYFSWIRARYRRETSFVLSSDRPPAGDPYWEVADSEPWRDVDLRVKTLYLLHRRQPGGQLPCCVYAALTAPEWN